MRWLSSFTKVVLGAAMLVALASLARPAAAADAPTTHKPSQKWALLIGVNDYAYINKLKYCGADMDALRGRLIEAGFPENHVYLLSDNVKDTKYHPNKTNIEAQIDLVTKLVGKDDVLVLAFAGHGVHLGDVDYICPVDARLDDSKSSLVSLDSVYERVRKSPAALKIMLVDACRDDPTPGGKRSAADTAEENRKFAKRLEKTPQGIVLLNSCSPGESSMEDAKLSHGVFTYFLLEGLAGKADANGDGVVTLAELAEYVGDQTKNHVAGQWASLQRPYLKGDLSLDAMRFDIGRIGPKVLPRKLFNSLGQEFALIPAGEFMMGNEESVDDVLKVFPYANPGMVEDAAKQHKVRITKPFYMGVHHVTKGDFARFVSAEGYQTDAEKDGKGGDGLLADGTSIQQREFTWRNAGFQQDDDHPVVNVSWNDAMAYVAWLSKKDGRQYRLPTEAEWEYSCRAGATTRYSNGNDPERLVEIANVEDATTIKKYPNFPWPAIKATDGYAHTSPVGRFKPNKFGLFDMHGNAWHWCADWYDGDYYAKSPVDDPQGPDSGTCHVLRGGGWAGPGVYCRSAVRIYCPPDKRDYSLGFRVALVANPQVELSLDNVRLDSGRAAKPLEKSLVNDLGQKFALIPPGEFLMGNEESVESLLKAFPYNGREAVADAARQHRVRITKPFYMGVHQVTKGDFALFVAAEGYKTDAEQDGNGGWGLKPDGNIFQAPEFNWRNVGFPQGDDHPVLNVSWNDAMAYIGWLSRKDHRPYRLPTEAEWEYACRAGSTTRYSNGNDPERLVEIANVADGTTRKKYPDWPWPTIKAEDGFAYSSPVGHFKPNKFGLFDMHGNAWHWCADWYDKDYYANSPTIDPRGPESGVNHVLRGGGWGGHPACCRSAVRISYPPNDRDNTLGFRLALDAAN